jgi:prepilin-type N-terminal cleavage/methylation domain-containing protein
MISLPPNVLQSAESASMRLSTSFATSPCEGEASSPGSDLRPLISGLRSSGAQRLSTLAPRRSTAFTLIELLVVISIIAILAGLAFPAVNGALNSARKAQARNDVQQIVAAVKAFQAEYGKFPTDDINTSDNDVADHYYDSNSAIMKALLAKNDTLNPKKIVFLDAKESGKGRGGIRLQDDEFIDPWGKSYIIKLDTNYNGKTEYYGDRYTTVIVFSTGPNGTPDNPTQSGDDIYSFK